MTQAPVHADLAEVIGDDARWPRPGDALAEVPEVSPWWRSAPWGGSGRPWLDAGSPTGVVAPEHGDTATDAHMAIARVDADRRPGVGIGVPLVALGGAASLALALLTGRAWGRAATTAGELDWGVLTASDAHAGLFTLGWLLATMVLGTGWLLCHARRSASPSALWALLVGTAIPVLSVLGALALLAPALDNIPG